MSVSSLNSLFNPVHVLSTALQSITGSTTKTATTGQSSISGSAPDSSQLSPFAKLLSTLQKLQQTDPAKYKLVTAQIAGKLQDAAQTAKSNGNSAESAQLSLLAGDFTKASTSGQISDLQDLAGKVAGTGGHHHHHAPPTSDNGSTTGQSIEQLFSSAGPQSDSTNAASIVLHALNAASV